jgi:hypothetical protein
VDSKQQEVKVYGGKKVQTLSLKNQSVLQWKSKPVPLPAIFDLR